MENASGTVTIEQGSSIHDNRAKFGGGITNARPQTGAPEGRVRVIQSSVTANLAEHTTAVGGGINNLSKHAEFGLIVENSLIESNEARGVGGQGGRGGGIYNVGTARIAGTGATPSYVTLNRASLEGGGIHTGSDPADGFQGTMVIEQTSIKGNRLSLFGYGAGIFNSSFGPDAMTFGLQVARSTIAQNEVDAMNGGWGGGLYNGSFARATLSNTTGSGNRASRGAGIYQAFLSIVQTRNVTVASNTATQGGTGQGGGVYLEANAQFDMANTIIAGNAADQYPDIVGAVTSLGHNLIGDGTGGSGFVPSDLVGTESSPIDPLLAPLDRYGGPTETHVLLEGSPALDAGDDGYAALPYDQRGYARIVGAAVDIGAVEMEQGEAMSALLRRLRPIARSRRLR